MKIVLYCYAELQVNDAYTARQTQRDKNPARQTQRFNSLPLSKLPVVEFLSNFEVS